MCFRRLSIAAASDDSPAGCWDAMILIGLAWLCFLMGSDVGRIIESDWGKCMSVLCFELLAPLF